MVDATQPRTSRLCATHFTTDYSQFVPSLQLEVIFEFIDVFVHSIPQDVALAKLCLS